MLLDITVVFNLGCFKSTVIRDNSTGCHRRLMDGGGNLTSFKGTLP